MASAKKTIGFLCPCNRTMWDKWIKAFEKQLAAKDWTIGDNVEIDYQYAEGKESEYKKLAKYFANQNVNVIVTGGTQATIACKKAAAKANPPIPVVFATAGDPIDTKLVSSFSQPGNITGVSNQQINLVVKRLDWLRQLLPKARVVALVGNDKSPNVKLEMKVGRLVAPTFGLKTHERPIRRQKDIATVIRKLKGKVDALVVCTDPLITTHADEVNAEAINAGLPTMHAFREYVCDHGGAASYGPKFVELFQKAAEQVNTILGGKAGQNMINVPVDQPDNFETAINKDTFRKLGLTVPPLLLARADHVI